VANNASRVTHTWGGIESNEYELVVFGASKGAGGTNQPQEGNRLSNQGFTLIGAKGTVEAGKIEMWIRKNNGRGAVTFCEPCGLGSYYAQQVGGMGCGWAVMKIKRAQFDLNNMRAVAWNGTHSKTGMTLYAPSSRRGFTVMAIFFDDSVQVQHANGAVMAFEKWGWGQHANGIGGDGISLLAFQPGVTIPSSAEIFLRDSLSNEYNAIAVNLA